ncbi:MAG: hypothetical protein ACO3JL_19180, partial [Myxococcota bacterium]
GIDDVAKHPLVRQAAVGAISAPYALAAVSFDDESLYVSWVSLKFEAENVPLHLYVEVDPAGQATPSLGKEYFGLVPELPFTPTHLIAARRGSVIAQSVPYNGVYAGPASSGTPYQTASVDLTDATYVASDNHTLSLQVPWAALSSTGCPQTLRIVAHVVKDAVGTEWSDVLPLSHSPWLPGGGTYYELDLRVPLASWSEQSVIGTPGIACTTAGETRGGTTPCGRNLRGTRTQVCEDGIWQNTDACLESDICVDDDTRIGSSSCGAGGSFVQTCTQGAWVDTTTCVDSTPAAWTCGERYGDSVCDCGCGAKDYDCSSTDDYNECAVNGCAAGQYPLATDTVACAVVDDVCDLPSENLLFFDGIDDVAKHPLARQAAVGAASAPYALGAVSFDAQSLYVSWVSMKFEAENVPLHLYVEVDPVGEPTPSLGKEYFGLVPELPFTPTHLLAARRSSVIAGSDPYNGVYEGPGLVATPYRTATLNLTDETYISSDNHTVSLQVPWSALSSDGCPTRLRLVAHVVKDAAGTEWSDVLPLAHSPWLPGGGTFYELDLRAPDASWAEQALLGTPGVACTTADETRTGTTPCGRNLRGKRTQACV